MSPEDRRARAWPYERRGEPLATAAIFRRRLLRHAAFTFGVIGFSLLLGVVGYHAIAHMSWVDALYNASMILGGMGPASELHDDASKLFASFYALYSGIVLLASAGLLLSPVLHRILHRFHLEEDEAS